MKVVLAYDDLLFHKLSNNLLEVFHEITSDIVNFAKEALIKLEKDSYAIIVSDYNIPF